jgi:hypothetical protein
VDDLAPEIGKRKKLVPRLGEGRSEANHSIADNPAILEAGFRLPKLEIDRRALAPLSLLDIKGDFLALREGRLTGPFDGRNMHEHVFRAVIGLDETIPLLGVEPFNRTLRHSQLHKHSITRDRATGLTSAMVWGTGFDA